METPSMVNVIRDEFLFNLCLKFTIPSQSKFNFVSPFDHLIMIMNFKLPTKATQKKVEENLDREIN
ncbi:hypothetical protein BpHYR1_002301 [Brachionus plicatilis]|uniref:Uncharacterized protein n=1 Tax=Brachionus plicatilis TaxID=10195 RepID=A0A3M7QEX7_BRAPC|nr:hypothetical protein BpHYR1_002301 [Brachionus plicatilis]